MRHSIEPEDTGPLFDGNNFKHSNTETLPVIDPEKYALQLGIVLHQEYTAIEAAKLCRISASILRTAKKQGELNYLEAGETRYRFLGVDLIKWKLQKRRIASAITTSPETDKAFTAALGTTSEPSKESQQAFALRSLQKQKSG